ncbi:hypothetical protein GOP47_0011513 [Adiantum capillus-veneris]|uniref:Lachrymatory factor synthase n=1 Tax=Adiantum capillus-veneris TaxID=13818 RepID=A0A9D4USY0_ADICA|nr:hypothetical protein GOP47_0011513 [Adiantum capillus-veneris]
MQECPPGMISSGKKWKLCVEKQTMSPMDDMWEIASKFCGLKLWMPELLVCECVDGNESEPGCIRFCAGTKASNNDRNLVWVKEQLLEWDPRLREFSYSILDSNLGFKNYTASFSLSDPCNNGHALVTWKVELSPVHGYDEEEFLVYMGRLLERNIINLERVSCSLSSHER